MKSPFFSDVHHNFRLDVRRLIERHVLPYADKWERNEQIPRDIWHRMGKEGLLGLNYSRRHGGIEKDFFYTVVFLEELARSSLGGFAAAVHTHQYMAEHYLSNYASQYLKAAYFTPSISGEKVGALAITEPGSGSDIAAIRTRATLSGDYYIINGAKTFITNAICGDYVIVAAKTDPAAGVNGISLFVLDLDLPGIDRRQLKKTGWQCSDTGELSLDNVKVAAGNLVGKRNLGHYYLIEGATLQYLVCAVHAVAAAEYCLETSLRYISKREVNDRALAKYQSIRHEIANLGTELEASRQLAYQACWLYSIGDTNGQYAMMAKLHASELYQRVADTCLHYFGAYGFLEEYLISRLHRDARIATVFGGPSAALRESLARVIVDHQDISRYYEVVAPAAPAQSGAPADVPPIIVAAPISAAADEVAAVEFAADDAAQPHLESPSEPVAVEEPAKEALEFAGISLDESPISSGDEVLSGDEEPGGEAEQILPVIDLFEEESTDSPSPADYEMPAPEGHLRPADETTHDELEAEPSPGLPSLKEPVLTADDRPDGGTVPENDTSISEGGFPADAEEDESDILSILDALDERERRLRLLTSGGGLNGAIGAEPGEDDFEDDLDIDSIPAREESGLKNLKSDRRKMTPLEREFDFASLDTADIGGPGDDDSLSIISDDSLPGLQIISPSAPIEDIFHSLPERFQPQRTEPGFETVVHYIVTAEQRLEYTVSIERQNCRIVEGLAGEARCIVQLSEKMFRDIEMGKVNPQIAFMMGKIKTTNVPELLKFVKLFRRMPQA